MIGIIGIILGILIAGCFAIVTFTCFKILSFIREIRDYMREKGKEGPTTVTSKDEARDLVREMRRRNPKTAKSLEAKLDAGKKLMLEQDSRGNLEVEFAEARDHGVDQLSNGGVFTLDGRNIIYDRYGNKTIYDKYGNKM